MHRRGNNNNTMLLLLVLLVTTLQANAFGRPRSHKKQQNSSSNIAQTKNDCSNARVSINNVSSVGESLESTSTDLDPHYNNCGLVGFGVVQKIPYQSTTHYDYTNVDVNFSSACMRCGLCIAIVERINQTLVDAHYVLHSDQWLDETEIDLFFRAICDHAFRHYSLREIDGERYIGDSKNIPGASSLTSSADGRWESTLKSKCHDILDDVGTRQLYKHWQEWCSGETIVKPLFELLCQSAESSRLRDCQNMDVGSRKLPGAARDLCYNIFDWRARVKVSAELTSK